MDRQPNPPQMTAEVRPAYPEVLKTFLVRAPWPPGPAIGREAILQECGEGSHRPSITSLTRLLQPRQRSLLQRLKHGVGVPQEAADAGHTLSVDMLSLSDGKLPSLSVDAMGEFQTESFRCESGFQMLLGRSLLDWPCLRLIGASHESWDRNTPIALS